MRLLISGFNKSSFYEAAADVITAAAGIQQKSIAKAEAKFIQAIYILLLRLIIITIKASHKSEEALPLNKNYCTAMGRTLVPQLHQSSQVDIHVPSTQLKKSGFQASRIKEVEIRLKKVN